MNHYAACLEYIEDFWGRATVHITADDKTLIGLPQPYITPNRDMFSELYYWDSFFIVQGLRGTAHEERILDTAENLRFMQARFGRIPNANRYYFLSRSQPPFFSQIIRLGVEVLQKGKALDLEEWLSEMYLYACQEYQSVWMGTEFPDHRCVYRGLSRYYDLNIWHNSAEAESGWDMTSRFFHRCLDFLPIDLNCILLQYEKDLAYFAGLLGKKSEEQRWLKTADLRSEAMQNVFWNEGHGFFMDFDFVNQCQSPLITMGGMFALWSELATPEQAIHIVNVMTRELETDHGLLTTSRQAFSTETQRGQWDYPNGWAPLHFIAVEGLLKYGYKSDALRIAKKWNDLVAGIFNQSAGIHEKYNVVEGGAAASERYSHQLGFGWTNSVFLHFNKLLKSAD